MDNTFPLPSSLPEVENLIKELHKPGQNPAKLSEIQQTLQKLQRAPEGWAMAQGLLANQDDKIRFFGALTIIIKLNNESSYLTPANADEIRYTVLSWLITAINQDSGPVALKKLCSALVTYFIQFSVSWKLCVRHLIHCLAEQQVIPLDHHDLPPVTSDVLRTLSKRSVEVALWFAGNLVEDAHKTDINSPKYIPLHSRIVDNMPDLVAVLMFGTDPRSDHSLQEESLKALQSWIMYARKTAHEGLVGPLRELVQPTIMCLRNDHLFTTAAELLVDNLSAYPEFFTDSHYRQLFDLFEGPWAKHKYDELLRGSEDFEYALFGLLMLALAEAKLDVLLSSSEPQIQAFLTGIEGLLQVQGPPIVEDKIFSPTVNFWSLFAEELSQILCESELSDKSALQEATNKLYNVAALCWRKIQYPPPSVFAGWDSADKGVFEEARRDVADLLQAIYSVVGPLLMDKFVRLAIECLSRKEWLPLEAALHCISAMSEVEDEKCANLLTTLFDSPLLSLLSYDHSELPTRLRQTSLKLIEQFAEFFERNSRYIPAALNLLFVAVGKPALAVSSSKTILKLCSSCRSVLHSELGVFLAQYEKLAATPTVEAVVEERIVGGIAAIIQAVPDSNTQLVSFGKVLSCIEAEAQRAASLAADPSLLDPQNPLIWRGLDSMDDEEGANSASSIARRLAVRSLRCLGSVGRGMRSPNDTVNLEANSRYPQEGSPLRAIQDRIIRTISLLRKTFGNDAEVVDACCNVIRTGFCEHEPGPFVMPPEVVVDFLVYHDASSPHIAGVIALAEAFISSLKSGDVGLEPAMARLLPWVFQVLAHASERDLDVELTQTSIDFTTNVLSESITILMGVNPPSLLEFFFLFTLNTLESKEPLAKSAANSFWSTFLQVRPTDPSTKASIQTAMQVLGPRLAQALIRNIGGNCARSETQSISEPLKRFVVSDPRVRDWLEAALLDAQFPSDKVSKDEKLVFLQKIINLRGAKATNQVVRDFWLACRGSSFAYVS